tara:strand:- start:612 stop:779 length:168 start_codon:yes stop_codon:yes gene_type:complete
MPGSLMDRMPGSFMDWKDSNMGSKIIKIVRCLIIYKKKYKNNNLFLYFLKIYKKI